MTETIRQVEGDVSLSRVLKLVALYGAENCSLYGDYEGEANTYIVGIAYQRPITAAELLQRAENEERNLRGQEVVDALALLECLDVSPLPAEIDYRKVTTITHSHQKAQRTLLQLKLPQLLKELRVSHPDWFLTSKD